MHCIQRRLKFALLVVGVLFAGFGVGAILFYGFGGKTQRINQLDNYAGGHFLTTEMRYHYSDNFYAGLMHLIGGWYRGSFQWLESAISSGVRAPRSSPEGAITRSRSASVAPSRRR